MAVILYCREFSIVEHGVVTLAILQKILKILLMMHFSGVHLS